MDGLSEESEARQTFQKFFSIRALRAPEKLCDFMKRNFIVPKRFSVVRHCSLICGDRTWNFGRLISRSTGV